MPTLPIAPHLTIHYRDHQPDGAPVVLLLHGLGATGDSWAFQIPALTSARMRVIAPDLRGFGQSTYPGGGVSVSDLSSDMSSLLHSLRIDRAHIIGLSMGGAVALQMAIDFPLLTSKLVLVNTFARFHPERLSLLFYFAYRFILVQTLGIPAQARTVARRLFPRTDQAPYRQELMRQIRQADPRGYRAAMRALARFDATQQLSEVKSPTLVISGEQDNTVSLNIQQRLAQGIPDSRQVIIPQAGHAVIAEQPEVFNQVVLDFLDETSST